MAAVVVTLDPDDRLAERLGTVRDQVSRIVVVDNGSRSPATASLARAESEFGAEVVRNARNLGIATALNTGLDRAAELGARWALTLDQDTTALPGLVAEAQRVYDASPDPDRLAVIAGTQLGHRPPPTAPGLSWTEVPVLITAGSLVSLAAFRVIGPFRDDFFVDYVDIEFCLRARRSGFRVAQGIGATIDHEIGVPTTRRLGPRTVTPTNHSPVRRYYMTRNRLRVWGAFWRREPRFVGADVVAAVKELVKLLLFEDRRGAKLRSMARGIRDAVAGRSGPLASTTPRT